MFEQLIELVNEKKSKLNTNYVRNKISKLVNNAIEEHSWDNSIKIFIKDIKALNWDNLTIQVVLSYWHQYGDLDAIFCILVKYYLASKEDLKWLFEALELSDLETILRKSIEMNNNQNYHIMANSLISFYPEDLTGQDYLNMISYTKEFQEKTQIDCKGIINFFIFKKSQYIFAPIPKWVSIEEGENLSLLMTVNPGKSYEDVEHTVEKLVKKAKDFFYIGGVEKGVKSEINDALMEYLKASSLEENPNIIHLANRVFGPANRSEGKNCVSNPNKNGPCRMLECLCKELDEEAQIMLPEWFFGTCDNYDCSKRIRDRSHCLRIPLEGGGWKGCFCSFECMDNSLPFRDVDTNFRIETLKDELFEDGIMDRTKT